MKHVSKVRMFFLILTSMALGTFLFLLVAELVLRLLPVATGLSPQSVNREHPVFHFAPNERYVFSHGWNMTMVNRGRVNNDGWVNDQDYRRDDKLPLLAVIGDSYIEAQMVPYADTMHGRLAKMLLGKVRVYSFGASGAPLSQYLVFAQYAVQKFHAQGLVINVVGNDFDESHAAYKVGPGFWLYEPDTHGMLRLRLFDFNRGWLWSLVHKSALARYLFINLQLGHYVMNVEWLRSLFIGRAVAQQVPAGASVYAGNTDATADNSRLTTSYDVIDAFFRDLLVMTGLPPDRIVFTVDGSRYLELQTRSHGTYFDIMRRTFMGKAQEFGFQALDLDRWFIPRERESHERFQFADDAHWNGNGHRVAADAAMSSKVVESMSKKP